VHRSVCRGTRGVGRRRHQGCSGGERGDFDALVAVLDPDVTLRADAGASGASTVIRGAIQVASQAAAFRRSNITQVHMPVLVNGAVGLLALRDGRPFSVFSPVIREGRIVEINIVADPARLTSIDLHALI